MRLLKEFFTNLKLRLTGHRVRYLNQAEKLKLAEAMMNDDMTVTIELPKHGY